MDIIAAIATAEGTSAIGVVRLSGEGTRRVLSALFTPASGMAVEALPCRRMTYGDVHSADGTLLDCGMAVCFSAAHSYTGEESAELHCHGSPVVLHEVLRAAFAAGARQARPGEFTQRAFLNGKLDLTEAEAVIDLIDAESAESAHNAAAQLGGALRRSIEDVYGALLDISSRFYAVVDYPDEEIEELSRGEMERALKDAERVLSDLLGTFARGRVLKGGAATAIIGAPNAGKSSLLNALVGYDRAIVTGIAGTTRDTVEEKAAVGGVLLRLIDTAGLRETDDEIESIGIERTKSEIENADIILRIYSPSSSKRVSQMQRGSSNEIIIINKSDLLSKSELCTLNSANCLCISAKTGDGMDKFMNELRAKIHEIMDGAENTLTINARTKSLLESARDELGMALSATDNYDIFAEHTRRAADAIGKILGTITATEVLDKTFGQLCLGK